MSTPVKINPIDETKTCNVVGHPSKQECVCMVCVSSKQNANHPPVDVVDPHANASADTKDKHMESIVEGGQGSGTTNVPCPFADPEFLKNLPPALIEAVTDVNHEYCGCPLCPNSPNTLRAWAAHDPWEGERSPEWTDDGEY